MIPLLLIALGVVAVASSARAEAAPARPRARAPVAAAVPSPIVVLGQIARARQPAPPAVIMCAIAEAEAIGRPDLASDIIRVFVAPVVRQHQARAPRARRQSASAPSMPQFARHPHQPFAQQSSMQSSMQQSSFRPSTSMSDEKIRAAIDTDPASFFASIQRAQTPPVQVIEVQATETKALPSPIKGVDDDVWSKFCGKLKREEPVFASQRHVGQFRQRKERLAELGIDPDRLLGDPSAQRQALDADLADAHHHATASGLAHEHVGRQVRLPNQEEPACITLSGVLGVIQAAGLEGAVGWLEQPADRKRYPHTTQAFVRTNGVF